MARRTVVVPGGRTPYDYGPLVPYLSTSVFLVEATSHGLSARDTSKNDAARDPNLLYYDCNSSIYQTTMYSKVRKGQCFGKRY